MQSYNFGIDIGSTTAKAVIAADDGSVVFTDYRRHNGKITHTLINILNDIEGKLGNPEMRVSITGSAGMGISEKIDIPFVQELVASTLVVQEYFPEVSTLIDIGGEDSKIVFFHEERSPDIRMNGSCAGGTGSFIDQMVTLLNMPHSRLNELAGQHRHIHQIASRCGVFAKTDVQNLVSRKIPMADISASILYSVAWQIKNSLLRGFEPESKILFSGGPLTFIPELKSAVIDVFGFDSNDIVEADNPELLPALGASTHARSQSYKINLVTFRDTLIEAENRNLISSSSMPPLFHGDEEFNKWQHRREQHKAPRISLQDLGSSPAILGIDSGSTTTKIVLTDTKGRIAYIYYHNNNAEPIDAVKKGLEELYNEALDAGVEINIAASAVTGYGEDLIHTAFDLDYGIVETIAHYKAAREFEPEVSFILDIGGQDMKAIYIKDGIINNIEINEACSSGCGSFIETFATSLDYTVEKFARDACNATAPCDLGTRCTVFMNSKVKQSFREGARVEDISAGLAYSVVQNCLHKVLKVYNKETLGKKILVQGGTFRNPAVHRAFEKTLGVDHVISPDIAPLMGAYGAALMAIEYQNNKIEAKGSLRGLSADLLSRGYTLKHINCKGCHNHCTVSRLDFDNGNRFYTGNRCENLFTNNGGNQAKGMNLPAYKYGLLFNRPTAPRGPVRMKIGIPRVLNIYEDFPFWASLFTTLGFEVVLSSDSDDKIVNKGAGSITSDNICFPAKIANGHIVDLIEKKVDRIFLPMVTYGPDEFPDTTNSYLCPVVSGYPDIVSSAIDPVGRHNMPFDVVNITFRDLQLLKKALRNYFANFDIKRTEFMAAFDRAMNEMLRYRHLVKIKAMDILKKAKAAGRKVILLAGRPYHVDPYINHKLPDIITDFGLDVITEDSISFDDDDNLTDLQVLSQWIYPNRLYSSAKWAGRRDNVEFIQLNSFGCGPDTITIEETREILESFGKNYTLLRIDEHSATGSLQLRIRSLIESLRLKELTGARTAIKPRQFTRVFEEKDSHRTILAPFFSPFHSSYLNGLFKKMGYKFVVLPPSDQETIDLGLHYVNNEICYPAILTIGDIIKALKSGDYDNSEVAVCITQTGGQCRASNYLSLLKKALVSNGYSDIPVVGLSLSKKSMNYQPGFKLNRKDIIVSGVLGVLYGDALQSMYYSTASRELKKGQAWELSQKYDQLARTAVAAADKKKLLSLLHQAISEFNSIPVKQGAIPAIGVVGEIYVKYNPMGNRHLVDELVNQGVEVVMPPLVNMFVQWFVNIGLKHDLGLEKNWSSRMLSSVLKKYYHRVHDQFDDVVKSYRYYRAHHSIEKIADLASGAMNMADHYFGEGWLIAGDTLAFAESGVNNILCLQPFGCIANHIVARGIEKRMRDLRPELNILYLDIDPGVSDVNLHNRLHLLVKNSRDTLEKQINNPRSKTPAHNKKTATAEK